MNNLPQTTKRRLQKIPQIQSVWEGDRRPAAGLRGISDPKTSQGEECIIWVDGSEGMVRAMDITPADAGPEAVVRTLLRAMENPHSPGQPARPQKIVVRNRELQFFLRGALQSLDIVIDYVPNLPLIDQLFLGFDAVEQTRPPVLPPDYEPLLMETARQVEEACPWDLLADHDIIAVEINRWEVDTIYVCVMGMSGQEYGLILYRSLDSLKQFRQAALSEKSTNQLEQAFLAQDCWFLNFESTEDFSEDVDFEDHDSLDWEDTDDEEMQPQYGSIHPYEGIRPFLDEDEAKIVYYSLQAFLRFFDRNQRALEDDPIGDIQKSYRFSLSSETEKNQSITLKVSTLPELTAQFVQDMEDMEDEDDEDEDTVQLPIHDDLIPDNAFLSLGMIPWEIVESLQHNPKTYYNCQGAIAKGEGLPVILVQTSRPKAKQMIKTLQNADDLKAICFNPGEDPWEEMTYDLGILQAGNGSLFIFGEFMEDDPEHTQARKKWDRRCEQTGGYCGLVVAMGVTGGSRGNPQLQDMLALFEAKSLDAEALAMGVLRLMPQFE
ncbi:DUF6930 domain-containing protein [Crocosphaera sp. XPORK-15E]|uniref:DUF6930 domain-containing protein n=1 Tax=Crocosphaera sp. XPORK-15E TaxID=3110247 RepID=UPI002B209566|nr:hypothetical protein [Crocosphaera sp. XPORK-15E]MEA5536744.1 hypothetical protein [Crocosphaera sp. XPORK-15E]